MEDEVISEIELERQIQLDHIANVAAVANSVASLCVGHRKILADGGFQVELADAMAASLHSMLLGLSPVWVVGDIDEWSDDEDSDNN